MEISKRRAQIGLYIAVVFLFWIALYLYVPTLPVYAQTRTDNLALIGVVISMYGLWQAIIRLPLGIAADWLGRSKPFIMAGMVLVGLGAWVMGTANGIAGLIVGRAITGLAAGTWVLLVVLFSSLFPHVEAVRATAILTLVLSVSQLVATGLTGWLNELGGYPLAFFLATGTAGLAILLLIPAQERRRPPKAPSLLGIGKLVTRRDVLMPALLNTIGQYVGMASTFGFIPILAQRLGAGNVMQSLLVAVNFVVYILGNLIATAIVKRIGNRTMVIANFVMMAVGLGIAAAAASLVWVFAAQVCCGLAGGVSYPVLMGMSIENVSSGERSTAMGLHQSVYGIGMFAGPWLSGILANAIGIQPMFGVTAFACLTLGLLGARWLEHRKAVPQLQVLLLHAVSFILVVGKYRRPR
jgi:MFS family permease